MEGLFQLSISLILCLEGDPNIEELLGNLFLGFLAGRSENLKYISFSNELHEIFIGTRTKPDSSDKGKGKKKKVHPVNDPRGYITLQKLYVQEIYICFENLNSPAGLHFFRNFPKKFSERLLQLLIKRDDKGSTSSLTLNPS